VPNRFGRVRAPARQWRDLASSPATAGAGRRKRECQRRSGCSGELLGERGGPGEVCCVGATRSRRAPSCARRRGHADPAGIGRRGRALVWALSCVSWPTASTSSFRGSRGSSGTWWPGSEVRGERGSMSMGDMAGMAMARPCSALP
jgi:hypothetical protein